MSNYEFDNNGNKTNPNDKRVFRFSYFRRHYSGEFWRECNRAEMAELVKHFIETEQDHDNEDDFDLSLDEAVEILHRDGTLFAIPEFLRAVRRPAANVNQEFIYTRQRLGIDTADSQEAESFLHRIHNHLSLTYGFADVVEHLNELHRIGELQTETFVFTAKLEPRLREGSLGIEFMCDSSAWGFTVYEDNGIDIVTQGQTDNDAPYSDAIDAGTLEAERALITLSHIQIALP